MKTIQAGSGLRISYGMDSDAALVELRMPLLARPCALRELAEALLMAAADLDSRTHTATEIVARRREHAD